MVRRVPQRESESFIEWTLRFLDTNKYVLRSRKSRQRVRLPSKELTRKSA